MQKLLTKGFTFCTGNILTPVCWRQNCLISLLTRQWCSFRWKPIISTAISEDWNNDLRDVPSPLEQDRWKRRAWISCRIHQTSFPSAMRKNQTQCHLHKNGRLEILEEHDTFRRLSWSCPLQFQSVPCQWCSDPWHSCWLHPPCQWSAAQHWTIAGRFQCGFHLENGRQSVKKFFVWESKKSTGTVTTRYLT